MERIVGTPKTQENWNTTHTKVNNHCPVFDPSGVMVQRNKLFESTTAD